VPDELSALARANPATCYDLLLQSAAGAIRTVAANPQHHPHVHGVVTGGGLSCDSSGLMDASPKWVACRPGFFLPVRVLSRVFRGRYLDGLRRAHTRGDLRFFGKLQPLASAAAFHAFL